VQPKAVTGKNFEGCGVKAFSYLMKVKSRILISSFIKIILIIIKSFLSVFKPHLIPIMIKPRAIYRTRALIL